MKKNFAALGVVAGLGIGGLVGVTMFSPGAGNAQSTTAPATTAAAPATTAAPGATVAPSADAKDAKDAKDANDTNEANETHGRGAGFDRTAHEAQEATDGTDAKLLAQAKVSPAQATAAAIALAPGTAGTPDIHDRDGGLSYRVEVTTATGVVEVTVDATTGVAALDNEGGGHHDRGGNEAGETADQATTAATSTATA